MVVFRDLSAQLQALVWLQRSDWGRYESGNFDVYNQQGGMYAGADYVAGSTVANRLALRPNASFSSFVQYGSDGVPLTDEEYQFLLANMGPGSLGDNTMDER